MCPVMNACGLLVFVPVTVGGSIECVCVVGLCKWNCVVCVRAGFGRKEWALVVECCFKTGVV